MSEEYKIKEKPEDFIVKEESLYKLASSGEYLIFRMRKVNYTTEDAVQQIAKSIGVNRHSIGYAGSKDSRAITEQNISIKGAAMEKALGLSLKDITLEFLGHRAEPLSLGDLDGNSFEITIRSITGKPKKIARLINYFGEQRFSVNNADVGLSIVKKDFKRAVELICEASPGDKLKLDEHLEKSRNDFVGAVKKIPWKTLNMYIHALQSRMWNECARTLVEKNPKREDELVPLVGFGTEFVSKEVESIYSSILNKEEISQADFVIRAIPDLTSHGSDRRIFAEIKNLKIGGLEEDELNPGKKKCLIKFFLGKGSYATEAVKEMFS